MNDTRREREGVIILSPTGRVTIGGGAAQLREAVREALAEGDGNILIDLGEVTLIDSSGVGELVTAHTTITKRDRKLGLLNPPSTIVDLLRMTQLLPIFDLYEDEDAAIEALG